MQLPLQHQQKGPIHEDAIIAQLIADLSKHPF